MKNRCVAAAMALGLAYSALLAQDPVKAYPKNYSLVLEDQSVAVIRVHYGAHEKVGVHDHSNYPTIYIYLSDSGPVRFQHFEEKAFTITRPPAVIGSFRVSPGRPERHTVENLGDIPTDFLRIELKQVPLALLAPTRGKAPSSPSTDSDEVEFKDGAVEVERVICVGTAPCPVKAVGDRSLLVAITPISFSGGPRQVELKAGEVYSLAASQPVLVHPKPGSTAHLLRIVIPADGVSAKDK